MLNSNGIQETYKTLINSHPSILFYVEIGEFWTNQDFKFESNLRLLPFEQQTKIISKRFKKDSETALANQLLQRFVCCVVKETIDINAVKFGFNSFGKPYLIDESIKLSFSMSNQQGFTCMVINNQGNELGVDLASISDCEKFGPLDQLIGNFQDIFHEDEIETLNNKVNQDQLDVYFTEYWALKESYAKKIGMGLNADLKTFNFKCVNSVKYIESENNQMSLPIQQVEWIDSIKLYIYDNLEKNLDIFLTQLTEDIVVSVVGDFLKTNPLIVKVSLDTIIKYFEKEN